MKDECDKLAAQLSTKDEANALLRRKYQLLKQDLDDKVSPASWSFPNVISGDVKLPMSEYQKVWSICADSNYSWQLKTKDVEMKDI